MPALIAIATPDLDDRLGVVDRFEPMHVQTLVAQGSIEGLHIAVIGRLARSTAELPRRARPQDAAPPRSPKPHG
jgi:hypothetical protein